MKPHLPLLALSALLLAVCSPLPLGEGLGVMATPTPTFTSTPTRTPTPTLTPTPTVTPTSSLPPEALTRLEGRDWRIEGDKVMAGDVAWYAQDAEGHWQPAQFVADFDSFQFSLEGLEIADEDGVVRIYDPNASDERARLVYEDGKVNILFAVEQAKKICTPTEFKPVYLSGRNNYWVSQEQSSSFSSYFNYRIYMRSIEVMKLESGFFSPVVIDFQRNCWGRIHQKSGTFVFEVGDNGGEVVLVTLMEDWYDKWYK